MQQALLCALTAALLGLASAGEEHVPECERKKIGILDIGIFAEGAGFPKCSLDDVVVNPANGIVYTAADARLPQIASHKFGTHAAPWYLYKAILSSRYYTSNLDEADIVYVYDYCYYIWWVGWVHAKGREWQDTPGDYLFAAYTTMQEFPRWKRNNGADFVLYDSHPGFMAGKAARPTQTMKCVNFRESIHIIVDLPMRNVCPTFWLINKILVTPYMPGMIEPQNPESQLNMPFRGVADRDILVYSRARCQPYRGTNAGKKMRHAFGTKFLMNMTEEVDVKCTDPEFGHSHESFQRMFGKMSRSIFCMAFPGDAASTRRLSEIFLAGCIPVFFGPPYHSMPFSEKVNYAEVGVFFNSTDYKDWLIKDFQWKLDPNIRAEHETEARWWVPDADIGNAWIKVDSGDQMMGHLRNMPRVEVEKKLKAVYEVGTRFAFLDHLTRPPNAVNTLMAGMCMKHKLGPATATS